MPDPIRPAVPFIDLQPQFAPIRDEVLAAIARVCDSQQFILGPEVEAFERDMAARLGVRHAVGVSSGTDALLVALMALGVGAGDEVVTTAYSFFATAGCVARLGARPVFVDIDRETFNLDPAGVDRALTSRTRAIVPVHLFGQCADMGPLVELSTRARVPIVEDAAQAIGAVYRGRQAGGVGTLGCFSFFPTKNLGAFGDAGLVVTDDDELASRVGTLRNHGAERQYYHRATGGNFRIDALQAAVLRVKAARLDEWTAARQRNAARYLELFGRAGLATAVTPPPRRPERTHIFHQFVIRVPERDRVRETLLQQGIGTAVYYPVPLHLQECFASLGHRPGDFPEAEAAARDSLALPIYPGLTADQQARVVGALAEALS